jgi:hypothetical protein
MLLCSCRCQFLALITGRENTYFERSLEALGVTQEQRLCEHTPNGAATAAFQSLMRTAAGSKSFPQMLAVLIVVRSLSPPSLSRSLSPPRSLALSLARSLSRSLALSLSLSLPLSVARALTLSLSARGWQQVVP